MLHGSEALGILLPKMGSKVLSKCFLEDPELNLGPEANISKRFLREKIRYYGILRNIPKTCFPNSFFQQILMDSRLATDSGNEFWSETELGSFVALPLP